MWSLGCIFAELLYTWQDGDQDPSKRYLFKGNSCYPLSPVHSETNDEVNISSKDQMLLILKKLGT
jgi:hypothetical protein